MTERKQDSIAVLQEMAKDLNDKVADLNEHGVKIPFLSSLFGVMGIIFLKMEEAKFAEFMNQIRIPLGFANFEGVADHIAQNIHKRWMSEGMARGWRMGMETMDDIAKLAAYAMAADYIAQEKTPDRIYLQLGGLFKESDKTILAQMLEISDALAEIGKDMYGGFGIVMAQPHDRPDADPPPEGTPDKLHLQMISFPRDGKYKILSADFDVFFETLEILQRNTLAGEWLIDKWEHPLERVFSIEDHSGFVNGRQLKKWEQLRKYLSPLRVKLVE